MSNLVSGITSIMVEHWDPLGLVDFKSEVSPDFDHLDIEDDYKPYAEKVCIALAKGATSGEIERMLERFEMKSFCKKTDRNVRRVVAQKILAFYEMK